MKVSRTVQMSRFCPSETLWKKEFPPDVIAFASESRGSSLLKHFMVISDY
jgi:hypothetical protein